MKNEQLFVNPFEMLSPRLAQEIEHIERLHEKPVSDDIPVQEGLLVMTSKLMEMCRLLSKCVVTGSLPQMERCEALAKEVHAQEKILTKGLVESNLKGKLIKGFIRFPYRLERIGDMFESILNCCRIKARQGTPFSDKAHAELDQLFNMLLHMMGNLRDAFLTPNRVILDSVISAGKKTNQSVEDFKLAHWERMEAGFCAVEASSMYRDMLDSAKTANDYLVKLAETLAEVSSESPVH